MFGTYRTILALAVIAHHLLSVPAIGQYAVHGFFILSGYLMTLIMHKSYGYSARGILSFGFNRFLRLYPSYWIVLILSAAIILWVGEENARSYHSGIYRLSVRFAIHSSLLIERNHYPARIPGDSERLGYRSRIERASHVEADPRSVLQPSLELQVIPKRAPPLGHTPNPSNRNQT